MIKSEEHTKGSVLTKTHASKQTNYARKCLDDILMHMYVVLSV